MTDMRGETFEAGDIVAISRRQGSSVWIDLCKVERVEDGYPFLQAKDFSARMYGGTSRAILILTADVDWPVAQAVI